MNILRYLKRKVKNTVLAGNNVHCSLCKHSFVTFYPFGIAPSPLRPNAMCPNCFSLERTRIYWNYISQKADFFTKNKKILHVAPETVLHRKFSEIKHFDYYPVDKFEDGYSYPKGTKQMDITKIDFPDNHFDFILCSHVLEHVQDDTKAMKELYRVLAPGGFGILQVPMDYGLNKTYEDDSIVDPEERVKAFGQYDHVRIYGKDYEDRLKQAGFEVEINDFSMTCSVHEKFRNGYGDGEPLYIVKK